MTTIKLSEASPDQIDNVFSGSIQFAKYTSFGNTFLIVNETENPLMDDEHRAAFARWALNRDFGIGGADNVLYLRAADSTDRAADGQPTDFVFRIFEHDGSETLSCGNGLLSTAAFLHQMTGAASWRLLTELPSGRPKLTEVGMADIAGSTWVNVGRPRPVAETLYRRQAPEPPTAIDEVAPLTVSLPQHETWAAGLPEQITLSGLLTFTGEPHMILFEGHGFPAELADRLWVASGTGPRIGLPDTPEMVASRALVHHLGSYVNENYRELFPSGVHLNFVRVDSTGALEYRTWERAIDCETLACGSGTVAMMHVGRSYELVSGSELVFWPHRCRWYRPEAALKVQETDGGFVLFGWPELVCTGTAPKFP